MTVLFIEGLASPEIQKEVRREHPRKLEEAVLAAHMVAVSMGGDGQHYGPLSHVVESEDRRGKLRDIMRRSGAGLYLTWRKHHQMQRRGLRFFCGRPGHVAEKCPEKRKVLDRQSGGRVIAHDK